MRKIPVLVLALLLCQKNFSQPLSDTEKKIISYINLHMPNAEKMLVNSVNINSGTLNKTGVKQVVELFAKEFAAAGFLIR